MIDTEDARCSASPTPWNARMMTSSIPLRETPWPIINAPLAKDPTISTHRGPTASAIEPASRSVEAVDRLLTDEGQNANEEGRSRSLVSVGKPTITRPLITLAVSVTAMTCAITKPCCSRNFRAARTAWSGGGLSSNSSESTGVVTVVVVAVAVMVVDIFAVRQRLKTC